MKDLTKLTSRQISQIKNIYKANSSIYSRIETLEKHLNKIQAELDEQLAIIEANEAGVKMLTGGFISKQLIKDEQIPQFNEDGTPKMDKEGKYQQKKRVLTFVAPVQEPTEEIPDAGEALPFDNLGNAGNNDNID
ncbi:MAG: hypothetical protein [Bacteriophage sp.]|jgi:hypothetical protein|nr:MAG: hypothetical protein [Bacteriophage sp.]